MKRLLIISALLLATAPLFAAKPLKVSKGSLDVFKQDITATYVIDLSQTQFVNNGIFAKEKPEDFRAWCGDNYDERVQLMETAFFDTFNVYSPGMELVSEGEAPYQVVLKVDTFERAQGSGRLGSRYISIFGTLCVLEAETGDIVLEVNINDQKGEEDLEETPRFPKTMKRFCRDLFRLIK